VPSEDEIKRLDNDFTYHAPKEDQLPRYASIRAMAKTYAFNLLRNCPPSRERSLALTALEESVMWGNASIARNE
jgi:hypothetical protein